VVMTAAQNERHATEARRLARVVKASVVMVVLLLVQYVLGISYNLYGTAPSATRKVEPFSSPVLAVHVVVGTLLIVVAIYVVVVSIRARTALAVVTSVVALASLVAAWISGTAFIQKGANGFSMAMGVLTAVALLCFVVNTWVFARQRTADV
jgi:hypothetical protein